MYSKINNLILGSHETCQPRITNCDVHTAIKGLKSEKSDGFTDLTSDSLINGTALLFKCISNVLTIMLQHGYVTTIGRGNGAAFDTIDHHNLFCIQLYISYISSKRKSCVYSVGN